MPQHKKLIAALIAAIICGLSLHPFADLAWLKFLNSSIVQPSGQIFLRLIFMVVVPLVFSALVLAAQELGQSRGIGRIALKTFSYTIVISALSVLIGVSLVNIIKPGLGFNLSQDLQESVVKQSQATALIKENAAKAKPVYQVLVELIPKNPIDSAARALDGEMISLMIFALIFGLALSSVMAKTSQAPVLITFFEQVYESSMRIMHMIMALAPVGIFALVFNSVLLAGYKILASLILYAGTVVLGLLIQQFVVYAFFLRVFAKRKPLEFFKACRELYLYAFSTSSSNATLPKALETAELKLKIPKNISRFVLTVGASANQNGTAIFEGVTVLFLAQVYGIDLSLSQQFYVVLFSILAGVGTAGVPGGSLPLIMILLQNVGIPAEGIGLILGIDRFLDMCRTTINVSGDLVIAALVAPQEKSQAHSEESSQAAVDMSTL